MTPQPVWRSLPIRLYALLFALLTRIALQDIEPVEVPPTPL